MYVYSSRFFTKLKLTKDFVLLFLLPLLARVEPGTFRAKRRQTLMGPNERATRFEQSIRASVTVTFSKFRESPHQYCLGETQINF